MESEVETAITFLTVVKSLGVLLARFDYSEERTRSEATTGRL